MKKNYVRQILQEVLMRTIIVILFLFASVLSFSQQPVLRNGQPVFSSLAYGNGGILIGNFEGFETIQQYRVDASGGYTHEIDIKGNSGFDYYIDWGDGTDTTITFDGAIQSPTHAYSSGTYNVSFQGDHSQVIQIGFWNEQIDSLYADFGKDWDIRQARDPIPSGMLTGNTFTHIPDSFGVDWVNIVTAEGMFQNVPVKIIPYAFAVGWTSVGNIGSVWRNTDVDSIQNANYGQDFISVTVVNNHFNGANLSDTLDISSFGSFEGDYHNFANNTNLTYIKLPAITGEFSNFDAAGCALLTTAVDTIFAHFDGWYTQGGANDPTQDLTIDVSGGTNAPPTDGGSNVNIQSLSDKFTAAGHVFTAIYNTP